MDKPIAKKPVYYRYRWHIAGGIAFIVLLVYVGIAASGGRKLRTDAENLIIGEATSDKFLEYVDVEGVVQPILTIQINTREAGSVDRIIAEEGTMMNKGDTILTLNNPDLIRAIEDQQDEWEKQLISYQEKEIEMEQKSIDLQQKTLQTTYELNRLKKSYALDEEEFNMGVKSKAQLEVARDEFDYKTRSTALQLEGLRHDSAATILRRELMKNDLERERKKFERARERMEDLVVRAPLSGQLSFVKVTPGQQVQSTEAIAEIRRLSPKPGNLYAEGGTDTTPYIIPDFILDYQDGRFQLSLNSYNVPEVRVNRRYMDMIREMVGSDGTVREKDKEAIQFVKNKIDSAKWFISAIKQRHDTLMRTMQTILDYQQEYFKDGDKSKLRPMILKDIADRTGLDVSTISRVVNSKYVQTQFGIILLKSLFSEAMQTESGEEVSSYEIKNILQECIDEEDKRHPLTDETLMDILNSKGYRIARRTVAKYREMLGIPVARLRKQI